MNEQEDIFIRNQVEEKFNNYLFPELKELIRHRILKHREIASKYFRSHVTPEFILFYLTKDMTLINGPLKEEDLLNKIIRIVEEGHLND